MKIPRFHLLQINAVNTEVYLYMPMDILRKIEKIQTSSNVPISVSVYSGKNKISLCFYKGYIFCGVEEKDRIMFHTTIKNNKNTQNTFIHGINRLYNFINSNVSFSDNLDKKWEQTIPLLNKVIEIEEQCYIYKSNYNQYDEKNIMNNGFIRDKENLVDKYVCIYECLQELILKTNTYYADYNNLTIHNSNNNVILSLTENPIYISQAIPEIKRQSIKNIVEDYKLGLIEQIEQLTTELTKYGHVIRKNYEENEIVKIYIDKQITLSFQENNIDSIEKCIFNLTEILEKDKIKEKELEQLSNENIERE